VDCCDNCKFWRVTDEEDVDYSRPVVGKCLRYAPSPSVTVVREDEKLKKIDYTHVFWPKTANTDWCGDFEWDKDYAKDKIDISIAR